MKKLFFVIVSLLVGFAYSYAQPTLLEHVTFENGIPNNWTASSSQYVLLESEIASSGEKCLHMKPNSSQAIMLTSPVYNITPGRNVRLEFSQLPIISSPTNGARIEVKTSSMSDWEALTVPGSMNSPGDIDRTFGGGEKQFSGEFYTSYYWSQDDFGSSFGNNSISTQQLKTYLTDESNYYFQKFTWKHTVFYLTNYLESTDNSFQIRFVVPKGVNTDNGWFIDDVRLFVSSVTNEDIRVPQISQKLAYPAAYNYPNCSDVEISFNLQDRNGSLNAEEDSIYIEYYVEGNSEIHRTPLVHDVNMKYTGYIPFLGVDSVVCWRAVINDHKNNTLTYPFPYGTFLKFKSVIPYVGDTTITSTGTSQGEMFINVNSSIDQAKYQMRYTANELLNAGFKPGTIAGIYLNITQAAGVGGSLHDFSLKMGTVASAQQLSNFNPYLGVSDVYSNQQYVIPGPGWTYFPFDEDKYFQWDGVSDIVFTVCYSGRTSSNGSLKVECIPATGNAVTYKVEMPSNDYLEACVTTFDATNPSMNIKPNFKFNFINTCFFEYDAGIMNTTIGGIPNAMNCTSTSEDVGFAVAGQSYPVKVKLKNYGTSNITATDVYWMIDGDVTTKQSYTWTGNLAPNYEQEITITNSLNLSAGQHTLAVWTELTSNSIRDWNMQNDSAFFTIIVSEGSMSGNYAIGGTVTGITPTRTFETFDDAFLMLMNCGVSGPVTFKVKGDSVYTVPVVIPDCINGLSATNYITFESADSGNPTKFATVAYNNLGNIVAPQTPTFDLSGVEHIRLKNFLIKPTAAQYLIKMSNTTNDIYLEDIKFESFNSSLTSLPSNPDNAA
ncbi:MAG: hypothetical protein IJ748_00395, partial [Bacteroidales bacterium]|nr:hypothetical protein [Bacteroidales bacterium]